MATFEIFSIIILLSSLTSSNLLFDAEIDEDTWKRFEHAFPDEIKTFEPAHRTLMCSLIFEEPYYNCNKIWQIWTVYGEVDEVLCNYGSQGCAYFRPLTIFIEDGINNDVCGRSSLHHELLHLKYYDAFNENVVHDIERCVMW